jgi:hypothetical protein
MAATVPKAEPTMMEYLQLEETDGKYRRLAAPQLSLATNYYRTQSKVRFEYLNPKFGLPAGTKLAVHLGDIGTNMLIANGYTRLVSCAHGEFVEITQQQMIIPIAQLTRQAPTAWTTEYRWTCYKYRGHTIYYADILPPGGAAMCHNSQGGVSKPGTSATGAKKKPIKKHPEFARRVFYVPTKGAHTVATTELP